MSQPKLHEILAVEGDLDATSKKVCEEAITTFTKKADHFTEQLKELKMFDEGRQNENATETKALVTTVHDKLSHVRQFVTKYLDTFATKEATNQVARADIVVSGVTIVESLPATVLLGLESKLKNLRQVYEAIPTLQPGAVWEKDPERGEGIYRARDPEERMRTEKTTQYKVLYEATKEHPAQVEKWNQDVPIGKITLKTWSGMLSPAEKSALLTKVDTLIRAVKKARQRANTTEIVDMDVGQALFNFIHS